MAVDIKEEVDFCDEDIDDSDYETIERECQVNSTTDVKIEEVTSEDCNSPTPGSSDVTEHTESSTDEQEMKAEVVAIFIKEEIYSCDETDIDECDNQALKTEWPMDSGTEVNNEKLQVKSEDCNSPSPGCSIITEYTESSTDEQEPLTTQAESDGTTSNTPIPYALSDDFRKFLAQYRTGSGKSGKLNYVGGEKSFSCEICGYKCAHSSDLFIHKRTHTIEKPYKCTMCDFRCAQSCHLTRHVRTHTKEKPSKCTICEYRCAQSSHLIRHMRTHTKEKPYKCTKCDYSSADSSSLTKHNRIHTMEQPFQCTMCNFRSAYSSNVNKHRRTHFKRH